MALAAGISNYSPFYNDQLGGTLYSDLEAFFNYDNNDDHEIGSKEHNNCIAILGNLIIDEDLSILECENIKMQPCSEITIGTSAFHSIVDLTKNTLYSCHTMWHGITVTPHATLNFTGNEIRDAQFANTAIGGVAQAGVPPTKLIAKDNAFLDNHVGEASISNNQFSNKGFFGHGIRINGSGGWDIADNILDFQAPAVPSAYFNVGIHLTNSNANYIYHNTVNDLAQQLNESTALSLADGTGNRYCCNITRGSRFGSRFLGACNKTEWRVTDMYNHEFALECGPGTTISPQLNYGDNFNETSGTAFHGGDDAQVFNSRFQVFSMLQPDWPEAIALPNIILNTQFFDVDGPDAYCVAPCTIPQYAPAPPDRFIDESDLTTVYGGFATGPYGTALQWENERRLYERMSDYGGMIGANATTDAFYTTASNVRIGAYYQAEHAAKGIYNYPTNIYNGLQTSTAQLESNRLAVEAILMGLEQAQNHADSALIYLNANTQHQAGQAIAEALLNYQMLAQAYSNAVSSNAYIPTNALPADNLLEQNRKAVQQLYLQTLGMGIAQLNPQQLAQAEAIAVQCPLLGGSAVYAARALYRLNNDRAFVDDELCMLSHEREEVPGKQSVFEGLSLAPNPANETVTINGLFVSQEQPVDVRLLDMNGKVFIHQVIETGDAKISIQGLLEGVYVCQIKVKDQAPVALKLIVVRKN